MSNLGTQSKAWSGWLKANLALNGTAGLRVTCSCLQSPIVTYSHLQSPEIEIFKIEPVVFKFDILKLPFLRLTVILTFFEITVEPLQI